MQLHKKYLFSFSCLVCKRDIFLKGPLEGGKGQKVRTHDIFINLHYSNITMVLIIRKCMFNRPALLINKGGCKIFFKALIPFLFYFKNQFYPKLKANK